MDIKKLKAELKKKTDKHPEQYYPVKILKKLGFSRKHCKCGRYFWSKNSDKVCGDCEGYTFIGKKLGKKLSYVQVAKEYFAFMKKHGYAPTKRYPVVARWRADLDFVHAAINNYQPYVVSGEVEPPANPLTVIQPSLRFNDIDNVGITGRHYVLHGHVEQFTIQPNKEFDQDKYFKDLHEWLIYGLQIPEKEIKYHEDAWGGGGNLGTSIEHFVGGLELGNQVYMNYEVIGSDYKPLKNRVLDMGAGHERYAWIVSGELDSYKVVMPSVCKKLFSKTKFKPNKEVISKFMPFAGLLNVDEVENIDAAYQKIASKIGISVSKLKTEIEPLAAIYSIADHSRALLFALADGALPSNVGGGYNLRFIYRRAYDFIQKYNWKISIPEVCSWHATELRELYPELAKTIPSIKKILDVEEQKYLRTKEKAKAFIFRLKQEKIKLTEEKLVEIYDSLGITPEMLKEYKVIVSVPSDFYSKVAERHEQKEQAAATKKEIKYNLEHVPETKKLFYENALTFNARVLKTFGNKVVLDKTAFYPTSGGQLHDLGTLNNVPVVEVIKQENHVIHVLAKPLKEKAVVGKLDRQRRKQLMQHHTATHLIAGAAHNILGPHIWQAGSKVTPDYARLDITHYANLTSDELEKIEKLANQVIKKAIKVDKMVLPKHKAEKLYGFRLYQGGAIPGSELRILKIGNFDVEACAGTHVDNTKEVEHVKITGTKKIQDGVIRLEYRAGKQAKEAETEEVRIAEELLLAIRGRRELARELVTDLELAARNLKTSIRHVPNTVKRFVSNLEDWEFDTEKYLKELNYFLESVKDLPSAMNNLFKVWKTERKKSKKK